MDTASRPHHGSANTDFDTGSPFVEEGVDDRTTLHNESPCQDTFSRERIVEVGSVRSTHSRIDREYSPLQFESAHKQKKKKKKERSSEITKVRNEMQAKIQNLRNAVASIKIFKPSKELTGKSENNGSGGRTSASGIDNNFTPKKAAETVAPNVDTPPGRSRSSEKNTKPSEIREKKSKSEEKKFTSLHSKTKERQQSLSDEEVIPSSLNSPKKVKRDRNTSNTPRRSNSEGRKQNTSMNADKEPRSRSADRMPQSNEQSKRMSSSERKTSKKENKRNEIGK